MGFAILEMFETSKEAHNNKERLANKYKLDITRMIVFKEMEEQWDGTKKFSVSFE